MRLGALVEGLGHAVAAARHHVGHEPFAVLLGDDIMHERAGILESMLALYVQHGQSVVALKQVSTEEISFYGCAAAEPVPRWPVRVRTVLAKIAHQARENPVGFVPR